MSLTRLKEIVSLPKEPIEAGPISLREHIEKDLRVQLPDSLFELGLAYGSGDFRTSAGIDFSFLNPFSKWYFFNLAQWHTIYQGHQKNFGESYLSYDLFPSIPGLFYCGGGSNRQGIFWLINGTSASWPIIYLDPDQNSGRFDGTLPEFFVSCFDGKIPDFFQWNTSTQAKASEKYQVKFHPNPPFDNISCPQPHEDAALGNVSAIEHAIRSGADIEVKDNTGGTVLFTAIRFGKSEVVQLLLASGANVFAKDDCQATSLIVASRNDSDPTLIEFLLNAGVSVNEQTILGETALLVAVQRRNVKNVRVLLEYGADPNVVDSIGHSPLFWAHDNEKIKELLIDAGAREG